MPPPRESVASGVFTSTGLSSRATPLSTVSETARTSPSEVFPSAGTFPAASGKCLRQGPGHRGRPGPSRPGPRSGAFPSPCPSASSPARRAWCPDRRAPRRRRRCRRAACPCRRRSGPAPGRGLAPRAGGRRGAPRARGAPRCRRPGAGRRRRRGSGSSPSPRRPASRDRAPRRARARRGRPGSGPAPRRCPSIRRSGADRPGPGLGFAGVAVPAWSCLAGEQQRVGVEVGRPGGHREGGGGLLPVPWSSTEAVPSTASPRTFRDQASIWRRVAARAAASRAPRATSASRAACPARPPAGGRPR